MPSSTALQAVSIMALWVMALSAARFSATTAYALTPLLVAVFRSLKWAMDSHSRKREFIYALEKIQMRFSISLCTPWSVPLLIFGLVLIGVAFAFLTSGDIMVLVAREPGLWEDSDRYLDCFAAIIGGLGFAATLSAISKRRTISFLISTAFAITGLGIGIVAAVYV